MLDFKSCFLPRRRTAGGAQVQISLASVILRTSNPNVMLKATCGTTPVQPALHCRPLVPTRHRAARAHKLWAIIYRFLNADY